MREGQVTAALDSWGALIGVSAHTSRLRLGTLVSPVTFRHPSLTAKLVVTADHISGGRVELGLGTGWLESEHRQYGFPFPDAPARFEELQEQMEIIHRQWTEEAFTFSGTRYTLTNVPSLPKPIQQPHPPLILGGSGGKRGLALAARWADEYNTFGASEDECVHRRRRLHDACRDVNRDPGSVRFSLMAPCVTGRNRAEVLERIRRLQKLQRDPSSVQDFLIKNQDEYVIGTVEEVIEKLTRYGNAGVDRVVLDHLLHDDLDMVTLVGEEIVPALGGT